MGSSSSSSDKPLHLAPATRDAAPSAMVFSPSSAAASRCCSASSVSPSPCCSLPDSSAACCDVDDHTTDTWAVTPADFSFICGLDFGTSSTGFAFARTSDRTVTDYNHAWYGANEAPKTVSVLLLNNDSERSFAAFGYEALEMFGNNPTSYLLFDYYKLSLEPVPFHNLEAHASNNYSVSVPVGLLLQRSFEYIKTVALHAMGMSTPPAVQARDVLWVVTVPAIWDDYARNLMLEVAQKTFCCGGRVSNVMLALEPEAASLYCLKDLYATGAVLPTGSKYMVIDAGGGTVDIVVHQIVGTNGVKELIKPSGGMWGSAKVNEELFRTIFEKLFGANEINQLRSSDVFCEIMQAIEKIKVNRKPNETVPSVNIDIKGYLYTRKTTQTPILDLIRCYNASFNTGLDFNGRSLVIPLSLITACFEKVTAPLVKHVRELLLQPVLAGLSRIFLVGGFSNSDLYFDLLSNGIEAGWNTLEFPQISRPLYPSKAVLFGAVHFGFNCGSIITRIAPVTIGVGMSQVWNSLLHRGRKKIDIGGVEYCDNVFDTLIKAGDALNFDHCIIKKYKPTSSTQETAQIPILWSETRDVSFTDAPNVFLQGYLKFQIPHFGEPIEAREVSVNMQYGGTATVVFARCHGTRIPAHIEFSPSHRPVAQVLSPNYSSVDIAFAMDCTGSMSCWLSNTKAIVNSLAAETSARLPNFTKRFAFVGYRDITDTNRFHSLDFTETVTDFSNFIAPISADGGDDTPEDIFGALLKVSRLNWQSRCRVLIHIGDAPCHGTMFHECTDDSFPSGDPEHNTLDGVMEALHRQRLDYYFLEIHQITRKMTTKFAECYRGKNCLFQVKEMTSSTELLPAILNCVLTSVTQTNT
ncbi:heat shock 70 kDa protein 12A [Pelomyxa schiedti]|nr:heat shock 70 kDa protein 12A [Pelomyxa schiedti]